MTNLKKFKKKIYSQNGEDGIIEEILNRLDGELDHTCCEFGAWNGIYLSNVYNLVENKDYKVLFIEGDRSKFKKLEENLKEMYINRINDYEKSHITIDVDNIPVSEVISKIKKKLASYDQTS